MKSVIYDYHGERMKRKADFVMQNIGGIKLLVPLGLQVMKLNGIITLSDTGVYIWELLAQERSLEELITTVVERFDVTRETAGTDVKTFVNEMSNLGLLEL